MADKPTKRPTKRKVEGGGRVTPKGGTAPIKKIPRDEGHGSPHASTRYTPPSTRFEDLPSPTWVPVLMFTLFALGFFTIFLNYVSVLPGAPSNWYLLGGLGFILGGIITATQYR
ncbi:MAG: cell division protein CrgA [Acidimicrobiales bacterium]|nr:cell division protein CrgA [Acidimicrobiales bacterium]